MKPVRFANSLAIKIEPRTRRIIENLAMRECTSLGEATRALITAGIVAKGIAEDGNGD